MLPASVAAAATNPSPPSRFTTTCRGRRRERLCSAVAPPPSSHRHRDPPQSSVPPHALEGGRTRLHADRFGNPYIVKNNFELKSAIRLLFEAICSRTAGEFQPDRIFHFAHSQEPVQQVPGCRVNDSPSDLPDSKCCRGVADCQRALEDGRRYHDGGRYSIHDLFATTCTIRIQGRRPLPDSVLHPATRA